MSTLSREVLKWLQSFSIILKNPKRDFANGCLIAVILDRYFPGEIQLNTLYVGDSLEQKQRNWQVLKKFFKRKQIDIPSESCQAVMHCVPGGAVGFVENIYMILTKRKLSRPPAYPQDQVPHFAIPTTSNAIKSMLDTGDESPKRAHMVMEAHQQFMKESKVNKVVL
ncbi:hypothetical protein EDD86DRAFT_205323 [Gorgonomyces haynaldii]|nr:hypothetical protein EDD86DRAFT_205323 [Gorgonomyces haynaldii]